MRLSKNFSDSEFACHCGCGGKAVDHGLVTLLELVREHFDAPVKVTSGFRCAAHNAAVGGAPRSKHVDGIAADIQVADTAPLEVVEFLDGLFPDRLGLGRYPSWTRVDIRDSRARW